LSTPARPTVRAISRAARRIDHRWTEDFSAARNARDAARGAWILYIDADERVVAFDHDIVGRELADASYACYRVLFRPAAGLTRYREYRLIRNHPELRFRGLIHESILPALDALCGRTRLRIGDSPVALDHLGYDGDQQAKPAQPAAPSRALPAIRHIYSLDHLGATLLALGDEAAPKPLAPRDRHRAREPWSRGGRRTPWFHLAAFLTDRGAMPRPSRRSVPGVSRQPSLTWLRALLARSGGDFTAAMALFDALTRVDVEALSAGSLAFDPMIFGAGAHAAARTLRVPARPLPRECRPLRAGRGARPTISIPIKRMLAEIRVRPGDGS
jgi:hypothetical protein